MLLVLTAINKQAQRRKFSCQLNELEDAFEILNRIVALGDTLTKAYIIDEGQRTDLPPEAFDGSAYLVPMQLIEHQWQVALWEPEKNSPKGNSELIGWTRRREILYQSSILSHQLMIHRLGNLLLRTRNILHAGSDRTRLIEHYKVLIDSYQAQLDSAKVGLADVVKRLQQLGA